MNKKFNFFLYLIIPLIFLFLLIFNIDNSFLGDLGRHIKNGEVMVNCRCIPNINLFSYTNTNYPTVQHSWLSEVIFYLLYHFFGLTSLLILKILLILTSFLIIYSLVIKKGSLFWSGVFAIACLSIFSNRFDIRPELFSYLFIALFLFLITKYLESKKLSYLLALLPISLLWVNMHTYFIFGIIIYFLFILQEIIEKKSFFIDKKLFILAFLLLFVTLINPRFIYGAFYPLVVTSKTGYVLENQNLVQAFLNNYGYNFPPVPYTSILNFYLLICLITLVILFLVIRRKTNFYLLTGVFFAMFSIFMMRIEGAFILFAIFPLVENIDYFFKSLNKDHKLVLKLIAFILTILIIVINLAYRIDNNIFGFSFSMENENAMRFIRENNLSGPIFNNFSIGNYLIFSLYPKEKVFVDARPEAYPSSFLKKMDYMFVNKDVFDREADKYKLNLVVFTPQDQPSIQSANLFLTFLVRGSKWIPIYFDHSVMILISNTKSNKDIIDKYKIHL